jgi:hypothetical protein
MFGFYAGKKTSASGEEIVNSDYSLVLPSSYGSGKQFYVVEISSAL